MATGSLIYPGIPGGQAGGSLEPGDHQTGGKYARGIISRIYKKVKLIYL